MELTHDERTRELQEALGQRIINLRDGYERQISQLPRGGKAAQTMADVLSDQNFNSRIAYLESLIQNATLMASNGPELLGEIFETTRFDDTLIDPDGSPGYVHETERFAPDSDTPYVNPFTGKMVVPTTRFTAGPSSSQNLFSDISRNQELPEKQSEHQSDSIERMMAPKGNFFQDLPIRDGQKLKRERTAARRSQSEIDDEARLSQLATFRIHAEGREEEIRIRKQGLFAQRIADEEQEKVRIQNESFNEARRLDNISRNERDHALKISRECEKRWNIENTQLEEQRRYAEQVQLEEQRKAAIMRSDNELARRVQREWGDDMSIQPMPPYMFGGEGNEEENVEIPQIYSSRRNSNAQPFIKPKQTKSSPQKVSILQEPPKRQSRSFLDQKRLPQQPLQKALSKHPQQQNISSVLPCLACMESFNRNEMYVLPCSHAYCRDCTNGAFTVALKHKTPLRCCDRIIPVKPATNFLSRDFIASYDLLILESTTRQPRYCARCGTFIPPAHIHGTIGVCIKCRSRTCTLCGRNEHSGVCAEDKEGKEVLRLANKKGWKTCPRCARLVEKVDGCLHMMCNCGHQWCWSCLRNWGTCESQCRR